MDNSTICINCEQSTLGKFCSHCGQKQGVARLTWSSVFVELQKRLFGFDNNYLRTVKDLTIRPHVVIDSVIEGNRIRYVGPVGYYFVMITVYILLMSLINVDMSEIMGTVGNSINSGATESQIALQNKINGFIVDNFRLLAFLMMPFFILGVWLVFKNKGYNFLETSVITFYGQAHPIWASIILVIVYKLTGYSSSLLLMSSITYLYLLVVITAFYKGNKVWNFIKALISIVLSFIFLMLSIFLVTILITALAPEMMKGLAG